MPEDGIPRETLKSCIQKRLSDILLYLSSTYNYMVSSTLRLDYELEFF